MPTPLPVALPVVAVLIVAAARRPDWRLRSCSDSSHVGSERRRSPCAPPRSLRCWRWRRRVEACCARQPAMGPQRRARRLSDTLRGLAAVGLLLRHPRPLVLLASPAAGAVRAATLSGGRAGLRGLGCCGAGPAAAVGRTLRDCRFALTLCSHCVVVSPPSSPASSSASASSSDGGACETNAPHAERSFGTTCARSSCGLLVGDGSAASAAAARASPPFMLRPCTTPRMSAARSDLAKTLRMDCLALHTLPARARRGGAALSEW